MSRFDPKWWLACLALVGSFSIQALLLWQGNVNDMPPWIVGLVSAIVAYYFGYQSANGPTTTTTTTREGGGTTTTTATPKNS